MAHVDELGNNVKPKHKSTGHVLSTMSRPCPCLITQGTYKAKYKKWKQKEKGHTQHVPPRWSPQEGKVPPSSLQNPGQLQLEQSILWQVSA